MKYLVKNCYNVRITLVFGQQDNINLILLQSLAKIWGLSKSIS